MKFSMAKSELVELISQIQSVVPSKPALPILSNFMMEANEKGLVLTATDLTVGIRCFVSAQINTQGSTTLPSRRFFQLIKELTSPQLEINVNEQDICQVQAFSSLFKLNGMPKSEFPLLPTLDEAQKISISKEELKEMFYKTSFAVSKDENRYLMTGILIKIENGTMMMVGTDARRLSKVERSIQIDPSFSQEYIVPLKGVDEIQKILDRSTDQNVVLYLANDRIAIETSNIMLVTKLLVGDFPDFKSVVPQAVHYSVNVHREELITMLRQVAIFTDEMTGACQFHLEKGELTLFSQHHEIGEARISMPVDYSEDPFEIAFNPYHILDVLRHTTDETLSFAFIDAFNPALIEDSKKALFVIMPMRKS
jgi:DNA polymerase-3 subunit beta